MKLGLDAENPELFGRINNKLKILGHSTVYCTPQGIINKGDALHKSVLAANQGKVDLFISIRFIKGDKEVICPFSNAKKELYKICVILKELSNSGFQIKAIEEGKKFYLIKNISAESVIFKFYISQDEKKYYEFISRCIFKGLSG
ncbi:hypothetical protein [Clostridium polynesiense]|uniref:hypothetical protein n=1 Tax=Clostridium polynesiense TaxID=1325933 RepID=UPI000590A8DE|nr:hypothetical protein [Clostridium polynesiense]